MREQSENSDFQGDNHVLISHTTPYAPLKPKKIDKIYKAFLEKEFPELEHYRLHDLRHTYFTWCTEKDGFSMLSITKTGGHSTIQSTERYQPATEKRMKEDMKKLQQSFANAVGGM